MEGRSVITLNAYRKKHKLSHPNLINKAKRQTIEALLEHGVWKIGEWDRNRYLLRADLVESFW